MSGPGGQTTKRDQRRDQRRSQLQQRQSQRQRERQRKIRNDRIRTFSIIGGVVLLVALLGVLLVTHLGQPAPSHHTSGSLQPANGATVDGFMNCGASEGTVIHIHSYLSLYVNGAQQTIPPGAGIVAPEGSGAVALGSNPNLTCLYPLHVHQGEPNIIHEESPIVHSYTLGNFFDVWGQPLSGTQVMGNSASGSKPLTFYVSDASGKMVTYTGDPRAITFKDHETIAVMYNSPSVTPQAFNGWAQFGM